MVRQEIGIIKICDFSFSWRTYPNEPYNGFGYYKMSQLVIVACEPNLFKDILITKFNTFESKGGLNAFSNDELGLQINASVSFIYQMDWILMTREEQNIL